MKPIRQIAILGAGVMGAQIAAHFANAHYPVRLYDLTTDKEGHSRNHIAESAIKKLSKMKPAPLAENGAEALITACNYDDDIKALQECDLVIEAIAEKMAYKRDLYQRIAPHIGEHTILASNTSGLSIQDLADELPSSLHSRFLGIHFFNPPRYMSLVELIPVSETSAEILDQLETFLTTRLGKTIVRAKNTPNFIANRIGVFAMLAAVHHAERLDIPVNVVDELTGKPLGRPKSATYRTADVVGLDTFAHVVQTKAERLKDDPWYPHYKVPPIAAQLIEKGALGQKTGAGFYKKEGKKILQIDVNTGQYIEPNSKAEESILAMLREKDPATRLKALHDSEHPQAQFLWATLRDTYHYAAYNLADIAHSARDIDIAMRTGFGWQEGPFESWQKAGWQTVAQWIAQDIAAGKTLSNAALPAWVTDGREGVHFSDGSYSPEANQNIPRSTLAVYQKQLSPLRLFGEENPLVGNTVEETETLRLFTHPKAPKILIVSFKTKMHTCSHQLLKDLMAAITRAESNYEGLVIWQPQAPFSAGADLASVAKEVSSGDYQKAEAFVEDFQKTSMRIRFSSIPVVTAVEGLALGGGCEFILHSDASVAALESYIGLVEVGVGLLPGGGGTKEFARIAAEHAGQDNNLLNALKSYFTTIAMAKVSTSAYEAQALGYLKPTDGIVFNPAELLYAALSRAKALAAAGYRPPIDKPFKLAGRDGKATLQMQLVNLLEGRMISEYDYEIANHIATVITGGDIEPNTEATENWLIKLEREQFMELVKNSKTHARIQHMLTTGKPLRN